VGGVLVENPEEQDTEQDIMALLAEVNVLDSYGYSPTAAGGFAAPEPAGVRLFVAPPHAAASGHGAAASQRSAMKQPRTPLAALPSVAEVVRRATRPSLARTSQPQAQSTHAGLDAGTFKYSSEVLLNRVGLRAALLSGDDRFDESLLAS
jgi:hypothetical protein